MKTTNSQLSCYTIEKTIGKGTFGKVKKGLHNTTREPVAIKILQKNKIKDITDVERVARELHILKLVRHSSIAQLYEVIETADNIFMVMEYAQNGEFFDYIMDGKMYTLHLCSSSQRQAHHYFAQIVAGLEYLHSLGIAHRDVKPQNMLLDVQRRVKIVDFGLSNMYKPQEQLTTACGSPCYASPEMIRGEMYDPELTDVWSLGIVLFTMLMAKLPFEDDNTSVLYSKIKSGLYLIDRKVSPQYKDLVSKLINVRPEQRLRLKSIRAHPWFTHFASVSGFGLAVGFDRIPIDERVVKLMEELGHPASQTRRYLQYNVKNDCTTTYYLSLKKQFKTGQQSKADICAETFDPQLARPRPRRRQHRSIDFGALVQKIQLAQPRPNTKLEPARKCQSQIKQLHLDVQSVGRQSCDSRDWDYLSTNKSQQRKFNLYNLTAKHNLRKGDTSSQLGKKKTEEADLKVVVNKLVRENRRLQTEHVREIYSRDIRESVKKGAEVSEMFWKKRAPAGKGVSRGVRGGGGSSKKGMPAYPQR